MLFETLDHSLFPYSFIVQGMKGVIEVSQEEMKGNATEGTGMSVQEIVAL